MPTRERLADVLIFALVFVLSVSAAFALSWAVAELVELVAAAEAARCVGGLDFC